MRHNLEAFAGIIEMRNALSLRWLAGKMADEEQVWKESNRE